MHFHHNYYWLCITILHYNHSDNFISKYNIKATTLNCTDEGLSLPFLPKS